MSSFHVDSSEIANASAATAAAGNRIRSEVATMLAQLGELQSRWQGAAQVSFNECVSQWQGVQTQVDQALQSLSQRLMAASQTYADAEAQAQSLFAH
ncbi:WXG100 family type VII secretion target [Actinomycetaceae bacterium TAE3-ERU4]|nr:WXG100 family type VII secretion target [Actinomycetaceae bacterium TAE3-ERU4]